MGDPEAIGMLKAEHATIGRVLDGLGKAVQALRTGGKPEIRLLDEILWFLREYADERHHAKEEGLLFPAMEANGLPAREGPSAAMRMEHEVGRGLVAEMEAALGPGRRGPVAPDRFAAAGEAYVDLLRRHIEKETHCLFALADAIVSDTELEQLASAFRRLDETWYGARETGRAERLDALEAVCRSLSEVEKEGFPVNTFQAKRKNHDEDA